jgi:regulatory factor X
MIPSEEQSIASPVLPSNPMFNALPLSTAAPGERIYPVPRVPNLEPPRPTATRSYSGGIKFSAERLLEHQENGDIELLDIKPYLPPKTDEDAANALAALYLTHATSLVDSVRFCKKKMFFRLFTQFQGTLTVPVQKLFIHPNIAPWIRECDYLMYQKMIRVLAPLTLQAMPMVVMEFLNSVSRLLDEHIAKTFQTLPGHLIDAKLEPATIFCQLIQQMLRANQSAHAAGLVLIDQDNRNRMWTEYAKFVQPKCMMNALIPDCGYDRDVYHLLTYESRYLLLPLTTDPSVEVSTHYEAAANAQREEPQPSNFELDRVGHLVETLHRRYPGLDHSRLLSLILNVTGAVLRDITMENGTSYNCWLVFKCFVDELALWLAHAGGFLDRARIAAPHAKASPGNGTAPFTNGVIAASNASSVSDGHSRYSSMDVQVSGAVDTTAFHAPSLTNAIRNNENRKYTIAEMELPATMLILPGSSSELNIAPIFPKVQPQRHSNRLFN